MKGYKDLEVYNEAFQLAILVHKLTMKLPKHEMYEIGSQIRRSSQSIKDNIVEGYGRRQYKQEFLRFLSFSHASLLETTSQLEMLRELYQIENIDDIHTQYLELGKKIHSFINYVNQSWRT